MVCPVTAFEILSKVLPTAIFAATLAIGYPVALLAKAELLLTRGLTSITKSSEGMGGWSVGVVFGRRAN